ncbi:MAG: hypothetical protein GAS50_03550, partial [Desulfobacterales bacterium]|nr:hypothetical protein [Desulfobacterales bacterium]
MYYFPEISTSTSIDSNINNIPIAPFNTFDRFFNNKREALIKTTEWGEKIPIGILYR